MRWFKHLVDSGDDPDIDGAIESFGADGYYFFFRTLEVMSREFDLDDPGKNDFSFKWFRKRFNKLSKNKIIKILGYFDQCNRIKFEIYNEEKLERLKLNCPKLKTLADQFSAKVIKNQKYDYNYSSESWEKIKKRIRKRDNFCCKICGKTTGENKRSLQVHHIKHFKLFKNPDEANKDFNLISLCNSCHNKARTGQFNDRFKKFQNEIQNEIQNGVEWKSSTVESESDPESEVEVESDLSINLGSSLDEIKGLILKIEKLPEKSSRFNPHAWVQVQVDSSMHPQAISETLGGLIKYWGRISKSPWEYANKAIKTKSQNYHERDHISESEKFKDVWVKDPEIEKMIKGIFK